MEIDKIGIEMQAESMSKYLEETVVNLSAGSPGICSWKSEIQWVKVSNDFYFLLFIKKNSNIWKFLPPFL